MIKSFLANIGPFIGGFAIGLSIPTSHGLLVMEKTFIDTLIFLPIGLILLGLSYYFKFIDNRVK